MNYRIYKLKKGELLLACLEAATLIGLTAFCFYNSIWVFLVFPAVLPLYLREKQKALAERRRKELKIQFKDAVQSIAAALAAGYSAENALREAVKDLQMMYSKDTDMVQEMAAMVRKMDSNQTMEAAVFDFAERSGIEEAQTFAEIFAVAKRGGGDLIGIMKDTARTISETIETERQVAVVLASKRYEQRIMNKIPFAMIFYLRTGCPGFLDPLYHDVTGICVMTVCLGLYGGAWYLGNEFLRIEV